jgi:uncharacterized membrane protein YdjX (TVP38/TMEM64 family)
VSKRAATIAALLAGLAIFFALDLQQYLGFSALKESHAHLLDMYRVQPGLFIAGFMAIHVCALALCLPGAVLTVALAGGAIFGTAVGSLIVLTSLTIGDSLGFLAARFLVGDWVRHRFAAQLGRVEADVDRNGAFYLLSLRLMAAMPYFVVNLTFGVTRMRLRVFAPVSFLGLAPATALYVNAGTELASITDAGDILSPSMLATFALLAVLPLLARNLLGGRGREPATSAGRSTPR